MSTTAIIAIVVAILAIIVIIWLIASRARSVATAESAAPPAPPPPPPPAALDDAGDNGMSDAIAAAMKDIAGEMAGVEAHPDTPGEALGTADREPDSASASTARGGDGDDLLRIKGLGPKAAGILAGLGVVRFEQIAAWSAEDVARIDAQLGAFKGRIERDRWVEQAGYLARGDTAGFEERFGKLG